MLPHGTGKNVRVIAIAKGDAAKAAEEAGAMMVGDTDLIAKIQNEGFIDFDVLVTTPDMMGQVGRLGKILGPRGLMPNPKAGTVTPDLGRAVAEAKAGKIEYRLDKANNHPCAHRQGFVRQREAERQPHHGHGRHRQGQARRCEGPVHQERHCRFYDGSRRQLNNTKFGG